MPSPILACKSCNPFARVIGSRFWIFLTITTSSGGRELRSRGLVVEESGDDGTKSPNDPKPPKSEDEEKLFIHQHGA